MSIFDELFDSLEDDLDDVYAEEPPKPQRLRGRFEPHIKECKTCGAGNLIWLSDGNNWYLGTHEGEPHHCPPASVDDFEVLT